MNESNLKFTVNEDDQIRFGLGAIKGVGEGAVRSIVKEREANGTYSDIYDFVRRTDKRHVNKRVLENLALAGALDCFEDIYRSQYFAEMPNGGTFAEILVKFGAALQSSDDAPPDLFGDSVAVQIQTPAPPLVAMWDNVYRLNKEKEVVGIYISAHPLDDFKLEVKHFARGDMRMLQDLQLALGHELALAGMVTKAENRMTKSNKPFGSFEFEDKHDVYKFFLFSEDYLKMSHFLVPGNFLFIKGKVQPRQWSKNGELEFKISSMELLADLREKQTKKVLIEMRLEDITETMLEDLGGILEKKNHGKTCPIEFRVLDPSRKLAIRLPSRSSKIDLSNETIKELDAVKGLSYVLK